METSKIFYLVRRLRDKRVIKKFKTYIEAYHFVLDRITDEKLKENDRMSFYIEAHCINRNFFYPV